MKGHTRGKMNEEMNKGNSIYQRLAKKSEEAQKSEDRAFYVIVCACITVLAIILMTGIFLTPQKVDGVSMEPTYTNGEVLYGNRVVAKPLSKWAFVKGLPTAISFDIVSVQDRYGVFFGTRGILFRYMTMNDRR